MGGNDEYRGPLLHVQGNNFVPQKVGGARSQRPAGSGWRSFLGLSPGAMATAGNAFPILSVAWKCCIRLYVEHVSKFA